MEVKDYKKIIKITPEEKETIKENSPYTLPLNPTAQGYSGAEIRKKLYQAIVGEKGSILELLDKLVNATTTELNSLATDIDGDKLSKIWTDIAEQTTTNLTDVLIFNRGSNVYKTTLANLLTHIPNVNLFATVAELPENGLPNKIYLVPSNDPEAQDTFDEYIWVNGDWEKIGSVTIDLSNYYNKTEINNLLTPKITKAQGDTYYVPLARTVNGKALSTNITLKADEIVYDNAASGIEANNVQGAIDEINSDVIDLQTNKADKSELFSGNYDDLSNKPTIPTKTSELVNDKNYVDENFVNSKLTAVYKFKGSVANYTALPATDLVVGDVYDVKDTGMNYAWNGTDWDALGSFVDLSDYYSKDETFSQEQVSQLLDSKVDKVSGKGLSSNDYTTIEKNKLAGIEAGAEVNPTASEVKILYESNTDTNAFTDLEKANVEKIPAIEGDIIDLQSNKADKTELFSGSYSDLTNKPAIYTKTEIDAMIGDIETLLGGI